MTTYAAATVVSPERSRAEIEQTVKRYGATGYAYAERGLQTQIIFEVCDRRVRFNLTNPDPESQVFRLTLTGKERNSKDQRKAWEQAVRQRWRALSLCIKAKLEAVESGIVSFDEEFLAHLVMPGGKETFGERYIPQIEQALEGKPLPPLLEAP